MTGRRQREQRILCHNLRPPGADSADGRKGDEVRDEKYGEAISCRTVQWEK